MFTFLKKSVIKERYLILFTDKYQIQTNTIMNKFEFNRLVLQHFDSLKVYARNFTKDNDDANDLVQETILKAILYFKNFKDGTNLKGWLYTIMKNTFINNFRRISKTNTLIIKEEEISASHLMGSSTKNLGENKFVMEDINVALQNLSEDYFTPFTMYFEGYKYHEISEQLSIPIGTVKTRIHVARKTMKKTLNCYR